MWEDMDEIIANSPSRFVVMTRMFTHVRCIQARGNSDDGVAKRIIAFVKFVRKTLFEIGFPQAGVDGVAGPNRPNPGDFNSV